MEPRKKKECNQSDATLSITCLKAEEKYRVDVLLPVECSISVKPFTAEKACVCSTLNSIT